MNAIHDTKKLMAHCVYGYPTIGKSLDMIRTLLNQGIDYLEIQYPFSDPVADGPSITQACHTALEHDVSFESYASTLKTIADEFPNQTIIAMTYLNPLIQQNLSAIAQQWEGSVEHLIIPDLPIEQSHLISPLTSKNIRPIWLITPGMMADRVEHLANNTHDVLYCVTRDGVTGNSDKVALAEQDQRYFDDVRSVAKTPFLAGFGIKTAEDAQHYASLTNGVIVGSVLLDAYRNADSHTKGLEALESNTQALLKAINS
jgi:tryptophan synthase alpha chain